MIIHTLEEVLLSKLPAEIADLIESIGGILAIDPFGRVAGYIEDTDESEKETPITAVANLLVKIRSMSVDTQFDYSGLKDHGYISGDLIAELRLYGWYRVRGGYGVGDYANNVTPRSQNSKKIQVLEERLKSLVAEKSELQSRVLELEKGQPIEWTGFGDVDEELIPDELDHALVAYHAAVREYDSDTQEMKGGGTPKNWLLNHLSKTLDPEKDKAKIERIATIANWNKAVGRKKSKK